jgi:toxin ParE1/3/4
MAQIIWSKKAITDLQKIFNFISNDSLYYAERTIEKIRWRTQMLKLHIEIGKPVSEFDNINLREIVEGNYRIIYLISNNDSVIIVTVVHSSWNLQSLKVQLGIFFTNKNEHHFFNKTLQH